MPAMKQLGDWTCWSFLIFAVVLSPVALILAVPVAIGFGLDVFDLASEPMMVTVLCAPFAFGLVWWIITLPAPRRAIAWLWARLHLEQAVHLIHAP
jgi:hypothetical protein